MKRALGASPERNRNPRNTPSLAASEDVERKKFWLMFWAAYIWRSFALFGWVMCIYLSTLSIYGWGLGGMYDLDEGLWMNFLCGFEMSLGYLDFAMSC